MRIEEVMTTNLTATDVYAINTVVSMLEELQDRYAENKDLIAPLTGEVVEMAEVDRVIGVLTGLRDNAVWEVQKKNL